MASSEDQENGATIEEFAGIFEVAAVESKERTSGNIIEIKLRVTHSYEMAEDLQHYLFKKVAVVMREHREQRELGFEEDEYDEMLQEPLIDEADDM